MTYRIVVRLILLLTLLTFGTSMVALAQAPKIKGKYTKKYTEPKTAHVQNFSDEGKRKRIRGYFNCCKGIEIPLGAIVSVYSLVGDREDFVFSYLVGSDGRFDFKDLKNGLYLLKTGTIDGNFNSLNIKVHLSSKDTDSLDDELEINLQVGT